MDPILVDPLEVLLIEDSASDALLIRIALDGASISYNLTWLRDGAAAVNYVRERTGSTVACDMVVLDWNVPRVSGTEILREIRGTAGFHAVPVMVLSSVPPMKEPGDVVDAGDTTFAIKPCELEGFLELGRTIKLRVERPLRNAAET